MMKEAFKSEGNSTTSHIKPFSYLCSPMGSQTILNKIISKYHFNINEANLPFQVWQFETT